MGPAKGRAYDAAERRCHNRGCCPISRAKINVRIEAPHSGSASTSGRQIDAAGLMDGAAAPILGDHRRRIASHKGSFIGPGEAMHEPKQPCLRTSSQSCTIACPVKDLRVMRQKLNSRHAGVAFCGGSAAIARKLIREDGALSSRRQPDPSSKVIKAVSINATTRSR